MDRFNLKAQKKRTDTSNDYRTMPPKRQGSISMLNMKDYKVAGKTKDKTSFSQKYNSDDMDNTETINVQNKFPNDYKKEESIKDESALRNYKNPYDDDYKNPEIEKDEFYEKDFEKEDSTSPKDWSKESIEKKLKLLDRVYNSEQNIIINKQEKTNELNCKEENENNNQNIKHDKVNTNIKTKLDVENSLKQMERLEKERNSNRVVFQNQENVNTKSTDHMDITGIQNYSNDIIVSESLTNLDDMDITGELRLSDEMDTSHNLTNLDDMDIGEELISSIDMNVNENIVASNNLDFSDGLVSADDLEDYKEGLLHGDDIDDDVLLTLEDLDSKKGLSLETDELYELENLSITDNVSIIDELDALDEITSKEQVIFKEKVKDKKQTVPKEKVKEKEKASDKESIIVKEATLPREQLEVEKQILYNKNKNYIKVKIKNKIPVENIEKNYSEIETLQTNKIEVENLQKNKLQNSIPKIFENENITYNPNYIETYCKESGYVFDEKEIDIINFLGKSESVYFRKIKIVDKNLFYINMAISRVLYLDALAMIDEKNIESAKILLEEIALCSVDTKFSNKALEKLKDLFKEENNESKIQKIINKMFIKEKETLNLIYNLKFLVYNL